jgi:esterase/lipase superfamily enzyme
MLIIILTGLVWLGIVGGGYAGEYDLCARGIGTTLTQTAHVKIYIDGPDLGDHTNFLLRNLVKHTLWEGEAEEVFIETYASTLCGDYGWPDTIRLSVTQPDVEQFGAEMERGLGRESPTMARFLDQADFESIGLLRSGPKISKGEIPFYTVRVLYATNRNRNDSTMLDDQFGFKRGNDLSFGAVNVTIPKDHRMGHLETPSILMLRWLKDPHKHITLQSIELTNLESWRDELQRRALPLGKPGVLLFIHGYNVSFAGAAMRTAQLAYDLGFAGAAVFFSWPSRGELIPYISDEQAAEWSAHDVKTVLAELASLGPDVPVYVIAHSMGNRVLTRALKDLATQDRTQLAAFKEIALTAPDIDADVFKREIAPAVLGKGPRVTLYASSNDVALVASRKLHGGYRRLGESDPEVLVMKDMDTVDASNIKTDFMGHSYFGDSGTVMADLFYLIRQRLKPAERFALEPVHSTGGDYWRFKQ